MDKEKRSTRQLCKQALETVEQSLIELPSVEGLGVVKHAPDDEYRVAVYVSQIPKDKAELAALPKSIQLPNSKESVKTTIIEIGKVGPEEKAEMDEALEKAASARGNNEQKSEPPSLGKEPM